MKFRGVLGSFQKYSVLIIGNDDSTVKTLEDRITKTAKEKKVKVNFSTTLIPSGEDLKDYYSTLVGEYLEKHNINTLPAIIIDDILFSSGIFPTEGDFISFFEEGFTPSVSALIEVNKFEPKINLNEHNSQSFDNKSSRVNSEEFEKPQPIPVDVISNASVTGASTELKRNDSSEKVDELIAVLVGSQSSSTGVSEEVPIIEKSSSEEVEPEEVKVKQSCVICSHFLPQTKICGHLLKRVKMSEKPLCKGDFFQEKSK
jgi:hypothetical protein